MKEIEILVELHSSYEEAKKVLMEVLDAPVNATEKEMKSHFLSEAKALLMILLIIGAFIAILFGLSIPTGKVMVGLGMVEFKMPVKIVFGVNIGILLSAQ